MYYFGNPMARKKQSNQQKYNSWLTHHNFSDTKSHKGDYEIVKKVRDRFEDAAMARRTNCFWYEGVQTETTDGSSGGDWMKRWDVQEKQWLMWYKPSSTDAFRSNVKSPMTTGRVESTMHKLRGLNIGWVAFPTEEDDEDKAKVAGLLLDNLFQKAELKDSLMTTFKDALIHGSAVFRVYYQKKEREYRFPKMTGLDDKEADQIKEGRIVWGKKEKVVKYKDIVIEPIPLKDFYPDPQARCIHGEAYEARYVIYRRVMHIDDFKAEFGTNKNAMNVDDVKPMSKYGDKQDEPFFRLPEATFDDKSVEVLLYEDQINDEYIVVANDLPIINMPLPWNHKEIDFIKIDCIEYPHQFYGIGIADFLENIQAAEEILTNMLYDYIYKTMDLTYLVDDEIFGEFTESHMRAGSKYVPIKTNMGQVPIANRVQQLKGQPIGFDAFRLLEITGKNATMASQIDPSQMSLQVANKTATSTVINKEQVEAMVGSILDNFINKGLTRAGKQIWAIMQQKYSIPEVKKIVGENKKEEISKRYKKIRLEGMQVVEENGKIDIKESEAPYSFFEVKEEYLNTSEELDIRISPDSVEIISKGLEMQKIKEAYSLMLPNAVDPSDSAKVAATPLPLYDATKLARKFAETFNFGEDILFKKQVNIEEEINEAVDESNRLLRGEIVPGVPGRSEEHKKYQATVLAHLNSMAQDLQDQIDAQINTSEPMIDPLTGEQLPPEVDPRLQKQLDNTLRIQRNFAQHLEMDNMPFDMAEEAAVMGAAPQEVAPEQGMEGMDEMMPEQAMEGGPTIQDVLPGMNGEQPV